MSLEITFGSGGLPVKQEPFFDIFSGSVYENAMWIEAIAGLERVCQRMMDLAAQSPGKYFIFSFRARMVLASIDSRNNLVRAQRCKAGVDFKSLGGRSAQLGGFVL